MHMLRPCARCDDVHGLADVAPCGERAGGEAVVTLRLAQPHLAREAALGAEGGGAAETKTGPERRREDYETRTDIGDDRSSI